MDFDSSLNGVEIFNNPYILLPALAGSIGTIFIIGIIFLFFWYRRKKRKYVSIISRSIKSSAPSSKAGMEKRASYNGVQLFTYEELEEATKNFDEARELGDGGFGTVYYGKEPTILSSSAFHRSKKN